MSERQIIVREPWWLSRIKTFFRYLGTLVLTGVVLYGTYYVFGWYGIGGILIGLPIFGVIFRKLVKPPGTYIIEAKLPSGEINLFYVPDTAFEHLAVEGDLKFMYHTRKGKPVLIAEEFNRHEGFLRLAWSHELSAFEFMRRAEAFAWAREELHRQTMKNTKLELTLGELFALGVEENVEWTLRPVLARLGIEEDEIERALKVLREVRPYAERAPGGSPESES